MNRFATWDVPDFVNLYQQLDDPPRHTLLAFQSSLARIEKIYAPTKFPNLKLKFISSPEEVMSRLHHNAYTLSSIYATISAILKLMGIIDAPLADVKAYQKLMKTLREEREQESLEQSKSVREEANWMEMPEILAKLDVEHPIIMRETEKLPRVRDHLMMSLFARHAPVRAGNYTDCLLLNDMSVEDAQQLSPENNYLLETAGGNYVFIWNKFKTAKFCGQCVRLVEDEKLQEVLEHYITHFAHDKNHLFWNDRNKSSSISENNFSKALTRASERVLGKKVSVNLFRHIYITHFLDENPRLRDKMNLASDMGHSVMMQELYKRVD
jgi:site-specific recombinase XerD